MKKEHGGRCEICGKRRKKKGNYLCSDCADPEKIIWVCGNCKRRKELTPEELEIICTCLYGRSPDAKKGVVVKVSCCDSCQPEENPFITVFIIRENNMFYLN